MSTLSILPWNTCNARCAHCGPESGPKDRTRISRAEIRSLILEAAAIYNQSQKEWCLSLSGGEIFLYYNELLEYCQLAQSLNGYTTLITNCFWARTFEEAVSMLEPLKAANLKVLGVSTGKYHREFIPARNVANAIKAARKVGIMPHVRMASDRSFRLSDAMKQFEDEDIWFVDFMEMPITPAGRAGKEISLESLYRKPGIPKGGCPAAGMTINPAGRAMVCCNGAGEYGLDVGSIRDQSFQELIDSMSSSLLVDFLVKFGPSRLIDLLPEEDRNAFESSSYVSVCHLCIELFRDARRQALLRDKVEEWYRSSVSTWMPALDSSIANFAATDEVSAG